MVDMFQQESTWKVTTRDHWCAKPSAQFHHCEVQVAAPGFSESGGSTLRSIDPVNGEPLVALISIPELAQPVATGAEPLSSKATQGR